MKAAPGTPRRVAYLYLLPAFAVYAVFLLYPLLYGAWISLFEWDGLGVATWTGLSNYAEVFSDPVLRGSFWHALVMVFFYAVLPCAIAFVLVSAMARARVRGLTFFRTVLFLPQVIAMVAVALAWQWIYSGVGWLGDFDLALPAVGLIGTWVEIGLAVVLFMAGVQKIPRELYEAARVDGAGAVREFFAVTLPGLRRELSVALTLTTIYALRNFDLIYMTTSGGPGDATKVPSYEVYNRAFNTGEVGLACAIGITIAALILTLTLVITRVAEGRTS